MGDNCVGIGAVRVLSVCPRFKLQTNKPEWQRA